MHEVGQPEEQTATAHRVEMQPTLPPRMQAVQLSVGIVGAALIHHTAQEGVGRRRMDTVAFAVAHTQQPYPRSAHKLTF